MTSEKSDFYELKMALNNNENIEEFLLFVHNFNMTLEASGTLDTAEKFQYLCTLVCGETLQFNTLYSDVESSTLLTVEAIILGLGTYFFLLILYQSKIAQCSEE